LYLREEFGRVEFGDVRILAVDEVSERKGHRYLTIVIDYETGRVLYVGKKRRARTLKRFFRMLSRRQRRQIKAIAMDMWDPYIKAVKHYCRTTKIVFDLFHVKKEFSKVINTVRHRAYLKACGEDREVLKGSKFLLLSNRTRLSRSEMVQLEHLLSLNKELATLYMLKDQLNVIWAQTSLIKCSKALYTWITMALQSGIREAIAFTRRLMRYEYGIVNHALFPIHTGKLEGINNTIKVIKRRCYGFRDSAYFALKIKQAFPGNILN
jgi:transposase